ncbi:MAG: type III pantothenate kinase [Bacteroides sp.]|nr:type III pantothenate kinase [Bacteroides sp.]
MTQVFMAIDGGNTRLKATVFLPEGTSTVTFASDDAEGVVTLAERLGVTDAAMAASGHIDVRLAETLRNQLGGAFLLVTPTTPLPIDTDYLDPSTLGLDRKATAVAAATLYPGEDILVADAGTALTLDLVGPGADGHPAFRGGNISPGLSMRLESLHHFTARLPLLDRGALDAIPYFGRSTREAIAAGAAGGLLDEIAMAAARAASRGAVRILLTGGDAEWIASRLASRLPDVGPAPVHIPDLLAIGLRAIYDYQANV